MYSFTALQRAVLHGVVLHQLADVLLPAVPCGDAGAQQVQVHGGHRV